MMKKKLYYVVKSELHYYPPCVSQIRILNDLGADVTVLYGSSDSAVLEMMKNEGVKCEKLVDARGFFPGKLDKAYNWLSFRRSLLNYLKGVDPKNSILWFGNIESLIPMSGSMKGWKYAISFLELLDKHRNKLRASKPLAQNAAVVTACEETRAYLMKSWFELKELPYVIPNKPYHVPYSKKEVPTTEKGKEIVRATKGDRFVVFQGIFQDSEYLKILAQAMKDSFPDMYIVLMGIDNNNIGDALKSINNKTVVADYIPAPLHLQITSNAYIGVLFYKADELNHVFCAPNKIFEYSYFGIPMIGNNIPGLENTIGKAGAGICVDFTYDNVTEALNELIVDYDSFSQNSYRFYESVDNVRTIKAIAERLEII